MLALVALTKEQGPEMIFTGMNHMAFITKDIEMTIRFYRDLLEMDLFAGIGHDGYRHYFCSAPGSLDTSLSHAAGLIEIAACHA